MIPELAAALTTRQGREALEDAARQADPGSLAAATALRARFTPELAAAALGQEALRRKGRTKFGDDAAQMLFTPDGLEQASRPAVSHYRAARLVEAGISRIVDLGCGIGADSIAFARAGLRVNAVELDPATALIAQHNLGTRGIVYNGDAAELARQLLGSPDSAAFCDPARRDDNGRVWNVEQFTPGWDFVRAMLDGDGPACVKLGPGIPHAEIPDGVEAEWVSVNGDVVEVALWAGGDALPGARVATLLPGGNRIVRTAPPPIVGVTEPGAFLYEPNGAVIRAGAVTLVATDIGATLLDDRIAYLTADALVPTPFATAFAVHEVLPYKEKTLRGWVRERNIGELEIKKRGIDVDPAVLRRRLRPQGDNRTTLVLTRTPQGARVLVVERHVP